MRSGPILSVLHAYISCLDAALTLSYNCLCSREWRLSPCLFGVIVMPEKLVCVCPAIFLSDVRIAIFAPQTTVSSRAGDARTINGLFHGKTFKSHQSPFGSSFPYLLARKLSEVHF